jgi:hypothetical protein
LLTRPRGILAALLCTTLATAAAGRAQDVAAETPLDAADVFKKASASVVVVLAQGTDGAVRGQGSGVVVAPGRVVTNRHVVEAAARLRVHHAARSGAAVLLYLDRERDLALLGADWLEAPAVERRPSQTLEIGEHVYAVGAPQGLDLSLSDGLVSGLKPRSGGHIVQTTAPISSGSSGGGLFDGQGRLVGITAFALRDAQNMNYALPVDWIATLEGYAALTAAGSAPEPGAEPSGPARVLGVRQEPGSPAHVVVEADRPLGYDYASESPSVAILEIFGATAADVPAEMTVTTGLQSVSVSTGDRDGKPSVRIEVRLAAPAAHRIFAEGNALHLVFTP